MEKVFASVSLSSPLSVAVARTSQSPFPLCAILPKIVDITEIQNEYKGNFSELRKIIKSWNLISGNEFEFLNKRILDALYKNPEKLKIKRILESELITNYGLYSDEFNSDNLTEEIMNWWNK